MVELILQSLRSNYRQNVRVSKACISNDDISNDDISNDDISKRLYLESLYLERRYLEKSENLKNCQNNGLPLLVTT